MPRHTPCKLSCRSCEGSGRRTELVFVGLVLHEYETNDACRRCHDHSCGECTACRHRDIEIADILAGLRYTTYE